MPSRASSLLQSAAPARRPHEPAEPSRRAFLTAAAGAGLSLCGTAGAFLPQAAAAAAAPDGKGELDAIDCHVHFYDPRRPAGVPFPSSSDPLLHRTTLPEHYLPLVPAGKKAGVVAVEASGWDEDNDWLLDLAAREPSILGVVGRLSPIQRSFPQRLAVLARNPRFRGVRINSGELGRVFSDRESLDRLKALSDLDLTLDLNGAPEAFHQAARAAEAWPSLRIVVNHLGNVVIDGKAPPESWRSAVQAAAACPNVFCKISGLAEGGRRNGEDSPRSIDLYRPVLDFVREAFGPRRLLFGSNWPVCERFLPAAACYRLVEGYLAGRDAEEAASVWSGASRRAYKL